MDEPPYHLDIDGIEDPFSNRGSGIHSRGTGSSGPGGSATRSCGTGFQPVIPDRPWVGIHFDCCSVYTRVYRNPEGTAYHGRCPRCLRTVTLRVGPGGTDARFFLAE